MHELLDDEEERTLLLEVVQRPEAFRRLYQHYFPRVYAYIASRTESVHDAEDLVSATFVRTIEQIGRFKYRGYGSFAAWLFRIAHNLLSDFHRRGRRLAPLPSDAPTALPDPGDHPDDIVIRRESAATLRRLIQTLPLRRQEV